MVWTIFTLIHFHPLKFASCGNTVILAWGFSWLLRLACRESKQKYWQIIFPKSANNGQGGNCTSLSLPSQSPGSSEACSVLSPRFHQQDLVPTALGSHRLHHACFIFISPSMTHTYTLVIESLPKKLLTLKLSSHGLLSGTHKARLLFHHFF